MVAEVLKWLAIMWATVGALTLTAFFTSLALFSVAWRKENVAAAIAAE